MTDFPSKPYMAQCFKAKARPGSTELDHTSLTRVPLMGYFYELYRPPLNPPVTRSKSPQPQSFEAALAEIETIVAAMEAGQLPLEQSLSAYKRGAELLQYCQGRLQEAQQQVKVLEAGTLQNFNGDESAD
jgi:exodeoxyribonuclease VII small subunit